MRADGWVAFRGAICHQLRAILQPQERQQLGRFTSNVIIGIVKPVIREQGVSAESLERQLQTMFLMRAFGWRLKELQARSWIRGYLVDGGDVELCPLHLRYLERSRYSSFSRFNKARVDGVLR